MNAGDWGLGRMTDPDYVWTGTPVTEITNGVSRSEEYSSFSSFYGQFRGTMRASKALLTACLEAGMPEDEYPEMWLHDRLSMWCAREPLPDTDEVIETDNFRG